MTFAIAAYKNGGFWVSENFSAEGAQPIWTNYVSGLPLSDSGLADIRTMCVDPDNPQTIQYLNISNQSIYKRDGLGWRKVFDRDQAMLLLPYGMPYNPPMSHQLTWITIDPITHKLYTIYSYLNGDAAWFHTSYNQFYPGSTLFESSDQGETWTYSSDVARVKSSKTDKMSYDTVKRDTHEIAAYNGHVWTSGNTTLLYAMPSIIKILKGAMLPGYEEYGETIRATFPIRPLPQWRALVKVNPVHPHICYSTGLGGETGNLLQAVSHDWDGGSTNPRRITKITAEFPGYISVVGDHMSSDRWWINPQDETDQRILSRDGLYLGYVDHYGINNPAVYGGILVPKAEFTTDHIPLVERSAVGNLISLIDDGYTRMYFQSNGKVWTIPDVTSRTSSLLGSFSGTMANYGLYVESDYRPINGHPYVFSVELGDNGTDDMASSGVRLHGSDSAYNTIQQASLHARDIKDVTPTVHSPWPAPIGTSPVSDGTKYVPVVVMPILGQVIRYPIGGGAGEIYGFSAEAIQEASSEASFGDRIEIHGAGVIEGDIFTTEGVSYVSGDGVIFSGPIYTSPSCVVDRFIIRKDRTGEDDLIGVVGPESGTCTLVQCDIDLLERSENNAYGVSADRGGNLHLRDCYIDVRSLFGDGYAGRSIRGGLKVNGGRMKGSTDWFHIQE
jgi:hypothetical protein